jgi:ketosteroid isomerase-like protein
MTRRRVVGVTLAVLSFFAIAWRTARSAAPPESATEEILKVDEARNQALQKGDLASLERIYSDDLVYANTNGIFLTKAEHLADLQKRTLSFKSFKHDNIQVTVHGDTGVLTGISTSEVNYQGSMDVHPRRFLNIFSKKDGQWLCVAHFETAISATRPK